MQISVSREEELELFCSAGELAWQPRRRQVKFGGIVSDGSSDSDSGGERGGGGTLTSWGALIAGLISAVSATPVEMGL